MTGEKPRLTAILVDLGLCSQADVDEVLARQLIFGGELELALLESGRVDEVAVLRAHAQRTGLKATLAGPLPIVTEPTRSIQSAAPGCVIGYDAGTALVLSPESLESDVVQRLAAAVGWPLENRVASGLRLAEALCFAGGPPLSARLQKLVAKTGRALTDPMAALPNAPVPQASEPAAALTPDPGTDAPIAEPAGSAPPEPEGERQPDLTTLVGAEEALRPPPVARTTESLLEPALALPVELRSAPPSEETAPPPADYEDVRRSVAPPMAGTVAEQDADVPESGRQSEKARFSRREAEAELLRCRDRDRIVQIALDYCSQYFQYTAVFAVQSHEARGLSSRGPGAGPERVLDLHIPLDLPSAWSRVKETGTHRVARLRASGIEGGIVRDLQRPAGRAILLIPVSVRSRTLLLIWGDDGEEDVDIGHSAPALTIVPALAKAIERVLLERKRASHLASQAPAAGSEAPAGAGKDEHVTWSQPPVSAPLAPSTAPPVTSQLPLSASPPAGVQQVPSAARAPSVQPPASATPTPSVRPEPEPEQPPRRPAASPGTSAKGGDAMPVAVDMPLPGQRTTRLGMSLPPARSSAGRRQKTAAGMSIPPAGVISDRPSRPPPIEQDADPPGPAPSRGSEREAQKTHKNLAPPAPPTAHVPPPPHEVAGVARRPLSTSSSSAPPDEPRISQFPSEHPKTIKGFPTELQVGTGGSSSVPPSPSPRVVPLLSRRIVSIAEQQRTDELAAARQTPRPPEVHAASTASVSKKKPEPGTEAKVPAEIQPARNLTAPQTAAVEPHPVPDEEEAPEERAPAGGEEETSVDTSPLAPSATFAKAPFEPAASAEERRALANLANASAKPAGAGTLVSRSNPPPAGEGLAPAAPGGPAPTKGTKSTRVSCEELVQRWLDGDEAALNGLSDSGEQAVGALIARFPGPVEEPTAERPRASNCGRILFALEKMGARATPFVTVRTADEDPDVRRWAVLLLGELPGRESARCIAERLLDDSAVVRRAALASARRAQADELTRRALRARLEEMIRDTQLRISERTAAIEAIADIREHLSIPTLLTLLADESPELVRATKWALSVLTRQDFALNADAWRTFWQEHRNEPREEWLIFAMLQDGGDLKRAAAEELGALLGMAIEVPVDDDTIRHLRETIRSQRQRR